MMDRVYDSTTNFLSRLRREVCAIHPQGVLQTVKHVNGTATLHFKGIPTVMASTILTLVNDFLAHNRCLAVEALASLSEQLPFFAECPITADIFCDFRTPMFTFMNEHYDGCMDEDSPGKKKASGEESQQQIDHRKGIVFNPGCADPSIFPTMSSLSSERTPTPNPTRQRHYRGSNNHEASGSSSSSSGTSRDMPPPKLPDLADLSPFKKKPSGTREKPFLYWIYSEEQGIWWVYFGYRFVATAGNHLENRVRVSG